MKLTQRIVESTKAPASGQSFIRDDELRGFGLRITANGTKSFVWEGRIKGRPRRLTIGQFPALTVLAARKQALEIKTGIATGGDPAIERERERKEPLFRDLAASYLQRHAEPHKRSAGRDADMLERLIPQGWKLRRLSDISRDDVAGLHDKIGRQHGHYAANRTLALLRTMFNLARDWGYLTGDNPAARIKQFREEKRERFISPAEMTRVNQELVDEPNEYWRAYFTLSLLLGTRRSELLAARWSDIDIQQMTWRFPETKAGRSHLLPVPTLAIDILKNLPSRGTTEWVFPGSGKTGHLAEPKKAWQRIRERAKVPDVRIHDLRRTLGSWLAANGYSLPLIGRALNHTNTSTTAVYARLDLDPVRDALEKNATLMLNPPAQQPL